MDILEAFSKGGPFMYVILSLGLCSLVFIFERGFFLFKYSESTPQFRPQILKNLENGDLATAENQALQSQTSLGKIVASGIKVGRMSGGEEQIQARMDEQLSREIESLDRRTGFLAMFGNVATLVGLLGTITGMIHSFAAVATASPMDRATLLSKGISEAMNCTAFGLIVAVPALVFYAIYQNKTDRLVQNLTHSTAEIYHDIIFTFDLGMLRGQKTKQNSGRALESGDQTQALSL